MATNTYILTITSKGANARYTVRYRSGCFFRLERNNGKLLEEQYNKLMLLVPLQEEKIKEINTVYKGRAAYTMLIKEKTLYSQFVEAYLVFYHKETGLDYEFRAVDGKALKSIIAALKKIAADDAESIATWQVILSNWHKIEDFYAKQIEVKQINSNINTIIRQVKDGKPTDKARKQADSYANDLRQSF